MTEQGRLTGPSWRIRSLGVDGEFTYTPDLGFTGGDSFTYTANDAGGASKIATVSIGVTGAEEVSINSTSANGALPAEPVPELTEVVNANYSLVAINDLGMHCGDLDTHISSILPPFNVLHAQVIERGVTGPPRVLNEGEVELYYSAASNPKDPAIGKINAGTALSSVVSVDGVDEVYKTNRRIPAPSRWRRRLGRHRAVADSGGPHRALQGHQGQPARLRGG